MEHYDITILGINEETITFIQKLQDSCKILIVEQSKQNKIHHCLSKQYIDVAYSTSYRNVIPCEDRYIVILHKERKNMQISTDLILDNNNENNIFKYVK